MEQKLSGTGDISSQAFYVEIEGPRHWRDAVELALVAGTVGLISSLFLTPYMAVATFSYGCLVAGLWVRKKRNAHVALMGTAILVDLGIVLTLEAKRHAIKTAIGFSLSPLQQLHIGTSTIATLLYIPIVYLGIMRFLGRGVPASRVTHMRLGIAAFIFRSLGFILMFSLLWKK